MRKQRWKTGLMSGLVAVTLLSGCMSRMASDADAHPGAQAFGQRFVQMMATGSAEELRTVASMPFWAQSWSEDGKFEGEDFFKLINADRPDDLDVDALLKNLSIRIYPLSDLEVLSPATWKTLQATSGREQLKGLALAAVGLYDPDEENTGSMLLLVRKVEGKWTWAGQVDSH